MTAPAAGPARLALRRRGAPGDARRCTTPGVGLALLLTLACGTSSTGADGARAEVGPSASSPERRHATLVDAGSSDGTPSGATPGERAGPPRRGELLVLDADAGAPRGDGEPGGVLFRCARLADGGYGEPVPWLTGPADGDAWVEPVAMAPLTDGTLIVLDMGWPHADDEGRGALFAVTPDGRVEPWWQDPRLRQPVGLVQHVDGRVYVSDRAADPTGLGRPTGAVFALEVGADGRPAGPAQVAAAGPQLLTPAALASLPDGRLLVMDADLNPTGATRPDGRPHTPGVLYELTADGLVALNTPALTVSPVCLLVDPPRLVVVDANAGLSHPHLGDGALWSVPLADLGAPLELVLTNAIVGERALIDPAGGDRLEDGRLVLADANADPLRLGDDGTGKGVYAVGHGAVLAVDIGAGRVEVLAAGAVLRTPLDVWRVRW